MQKVKIVVILGRWDRNVLLPEDSENTVRKLPEGNLRAGESPGTAGSRLAKQYGVTIDPATWVTVPAQPADAQEVIVLTVRAPNEAVKDMAALTNRKYWVQSELALCDAWVNPGKFEQGILAMLERARAALD